MPGDALYGLALQKLTNVLGQDRAAALLANVLIDLGLTSLDTADTLMMVARAVGSRPNPVEAALGSILSFQATLHGSRLPYQV